MKILEIINQYTANQNIKFLVIGDHAINYHGYSRQTGDLDLLVNKSEKEFWFNLLLDLKYSIIQKHEIFARFKLLTMAEWPIDLMFVDDNVFNILLDNACLADFASTKAYIPSIPHMISLKLHALKQRQQHRESKDTNDVKELLTVSNMPDLEFRQLCEKYDRLDIYESFKKNL